VLAAVALALLAPFMILVALLIRLTSPGPVIFKQVRCGLNGRRFTFYKFRSMCRNAEELKPSLEHLSRRSTAFKIPNDPRLTPSAAICANSRLTSGRSSGMCSKATWRWSAPARPCPRGGEL